jgi:hypothetical protein
VKNISPSKASLFSPEDTDTQLFLSLTNQNSEISLSQLLKLQSKPKSESEISQPDGNL